MSRSTTALISAFALAGAITMTRALSGADTAAAAPAELRPTLAATRQRSLGPTRGGRSIAVAGVKGRPNGLFRRSGRRALEDG
jgi:hypothetical protein